MPVTFHESHYNQVNVNLLSRQQTREPRNQQKLNGRDLCHRDVTPAPHSHKARKNDVAPRVDRTRTTHRTTSCIPSLNAS
ncbi:hypothetical protein Bpfe_000617 [Biomphalaria pfeifferi]|uniref:Uncharacterized protein n=1 Tax=Biomphalaria pfeifferi TaxID=112525 RepID=A0AAD8FM70_BIOPF|nr:hypothetical protein Bpfe_000617 [Biomphalaria pfeifferi]